MKQINNPLSAAGQALCVLLFCLFSLSSNGQSMKYDDYVRKYSPLTPNSASLGKFGEVPVSLYTGVPDITVPLYEIDVKGFKLPISLSYHAGGVKVEDLASWVGTGWSLNAGGVINRSQRGVNDERMLSLISSTFSADVAAVQADPTSSASQTKYSNFWSNKFDLEPDIFYYNFAGHSGKFFTDLNGTFRTMPANKLKISAGQQITYTGDDDIFYGLWLIKDNEGVEYSFGKTQGDLSYNNAALEINFMMTWDDGDSVGAKQPNYLGDPAGRSVNSWYLREIKLPSGDTIKFTYEAYSYTIKNATSHTTKLRANGAVISSQDIGYTRYRKALRLQSIEFPNGKVVFTKSAVRRPDLLDDYALEKVEVFEKKGGQYELLKYFRLGTNNPATVTATNNDLSFRLFLQSVTEYSKDHVAKPPYLFKYNYGLPQRDSYAQDLWGYFNGAVQNLTLVPNFNSVDGLRTYTGALRSVNPATAKSGTLSEIQYPTGGATVFEYEPHQAKIVSATGRALLSRTVKDQPTAFFSDAELTGTQTEVFGQPFTINNLVTHFTPMVVNYTFMGDDALYNDYTQNLSQNTFINVTLQALNNGVYSEFNSGFPATPDGLSFQIPDGIYRIRLFWTGPDTVPPTAYAKFSLSWQLSGNQEVDSNTVVPVGGLRVSRIQNFDPVTGHTTRKVFDYNDTNGTTGLIRNVPVFIHFNNDVEQVGGNYYMYANTLFLTSVSQSPLLTAQGGIVGYGKVSVTDVSATDASQLGTAIHTFTTALDFPDQLVNESMQFPFTPSVNYDWCLGLPKETNYYRSAGSALHLVRKEAFNYINYFNSSLPDFKSVKAVKTYLAALQLGSDSHTLESPMPPSPLAAGAVYDLPNGMPYLQSKSVTQYDDGGLATLSDTTNYTVSLNTLLNATESARNSRGDLVTTHFTYAGDLYNSAAAGTDAQAIKSLVDNYNKVTAPVEKYTSKSLSTGGSQVVSGTLYKYAANVPLPAEVHSLELMTPVGSGNFVPATINSSLQMEADSRYKPVVNYSYDGFHNISRQARAGGPNTGMLWGYRKSLPVATAVNASAEEMYFEGFESENGVQTAGSAHSGNYHGPNDYAVSFSLPNGRAYVISYWYFDGVWKFSGEMPYTGPTTLALGSAVDDVRIAPKDAQMTTYTHDPMVGVTSVTDAKGLTQYYDYDTYGRLRTVRNSKGEIVKKYDYHYQGQPLN